MSFYKQISSYYHHIFKINTSQVDFIKLKIPKYDCNILDIGCGIGTLSFELTNYYKHVLGIDMDAEMIRAASDKKEDGSKTVQFQQMSMLKLDAFIDKNSAGPFVFV